jgi:hypothetical protein
MVPGAARIQDELIKFSSFQDVPMEWVVLSSLALQVFKFSSVTRAGPPITGSASPTARAGPPITGSASPDRPRSVTRNGYRPVY